MNVSSGLVDQHTRIAKVNLVDGSPIQELLPNTESRFALLANLFVSEGKPGKVVKVHAKKRTGGDDFIASIRKSLTKHFGDKLVGLGGTFVMQQGKAKQHVMPDFSKSALSTEEDLNNWLRFYEMSAPLIAVGTLATNESVRIQTGNAKLINLLAEQNIKNINGKLQKYFVINDEDLKVVPNTCQL